MIEHPSGDEQSDQKKRRMQHDYDSTAEFYDRRYRAIQFQKLFFLLRNTAPLNPPIIDFGTGTGLVWDFLCITQYATQMANLNEVTSDETADLIDANLLLMNNTEESNERTRPEKSAFPPRVELPFIGTDLSWEMLLQFRQKVEHMGSNSVHLICADGENLPFRSNSFPSEISLTVLQNYGNLTLGIQEMNRVAMKSGRLFIGFLKKGASRDDFLKMMQIPRVQIHAINPIENNDLVELEDWLAIVEKDP